MKRNANRIDSFWSVKDSYGVRQAIDTVEQHINVHKQLHGSVFFNQILNMVNMQL